MQNNYYPPPPTPIGVFQLQIQTWKELIDHHFPKTASLYPPREKFDRLYVYAIPQGISLLIEGVIGHATHSGLAAFSKWEAMSV